MTDSLFSVTLSLPQKQPWKQGFYWRSGDHREQTTENHKFDLSATLLPPNVTFLPLKTLPASLSPVFFLPPTLLSLFFFLPSFPKSQNPTFLSCSHIKGASFLFWLESFRYLRLEDSPIPRCNKISSCAKTDLGHWHGGIVEKTDFFEPDGPGSKWWTCPFLSEALD